MDGLPNPPLWQGVCALKEPCPRGDAVPFEPVREHSKVGEGKVEGKRYMMDRVMLCHFSL